MQNSNLTQTIQKLKQDINVEIQEIRETEEKIREIQADETRIKQEMPELRKKLEIAKHDLFVDETDGPKLRGHLQTLQREKLKRQGELTMAMKSLQDNGIRKSGGRV